MLAAEMRPGETAIVPQRIGQCPPRLDADRIFRVIDLERNRLFCGHAPFSLAARMAARTRSGVAGISNSSTPRGASASQIALITAAGAPIAPPSPRPLAPVTEASVMVSR